MGAAIHWTGPDPIRFTAPGSRRDPGHQPNHAMARSIIALKSFLLRAPTTCSTTSPPLTMNTAGMPLMWNFTASSWFSSTFTLPTFTRPLYSSASSFNEGPIILQGPHHSAQQSSITGVVDDVTSCPKFCSLIVTIFSPAIIPPKKLRETNGDLTAPEHQNTH